MPPGPPHDLAAEARKLPKADRLLEAAEAAGLVARLGHGPVMDRVRAALEAQRERILGGATCPSQGEIEAAVLARLREDARGTLRRVVNATGVVIHTNLGRAPLSGAAVEAMQAAAGYVNLEYDLAAGERGDRYDHAAAALCRLTGAEAALVVNNNAAAVMLALASLCDARPARGAGAPEVAVPAACGTPEAPDPGGRGLSEVPGPGAPRAPEVPGPGAPRAPEVPGPGAPRAPEVIVSRGQLVEIGGGFRVPDVLRRSGCALVEVGTTNRTYARDFEDAIGERTRILLSVHRSNFKLSGFVADAGLPELVEIGRRRGLWVVDDLGSGTLLETRPFGLGVEPTVQERVESGADLVCFSGDKLLGGPQAGILVGRREAIARARRHPLLRALRVDKIALAGLGATLAHYERGEALREIPVWRAIAQGAEALSARAERWRAALAGVAPLAEVRQGQSAVGGGSLPEVTLPTRLLALPGADPDRLAERLRRGEPAVVARIEEGTLVLDPRTVLPGEDELLLGALAAALEG